MYKNLVVALLSNLKLLCIPPTRFHLYRISITRTQVNTKSRYYFDPQRKIVSLTCNVSYFILESYNIYTRISVLYLENRTENNKFVNVADNNSSKAF